MIEQLLRVSFSAGLVVLVLMIFFLSTRQRYRIRLKYWVWLFVALRLLIPFTVTLPEQAASVPAVQTVVRVQNRITQRVTEPESQKQPMKTEEISPTVEEQTGGALDLPTLLTVIWAVGMLLFLLYHLLADLAFRRYVRRWGRPVTNQEVRRLVARAKKNGEIRGTLGVLVLKEAGSPMVMGLWHPVLILPKEDWDTTELYYVLRHEMIHLRRRDSLYKLVLLVCNGVHWFNPLVWMLRIRANQDLEIACDMEVVAGATQTVRMQYCETIMTTAQRSAMTGVSTFGSTKKSIMERFREIFAGENRKKGTVVLTVVVLIGVLCGATVAVETVGQEPEQSVTVTNMNFTPQISVTESLQPYIYTDSQEYLFYCKKEGQILWGVYKADFGGIRKEYELPLDHWDDDYELTHALDSTTWIFGTEPDHNARNYNDTAWCISVFGTEAIPGCQELLYQFLLDNGIQPNPYCMAEPYYVAPGASENLETHYALYDPERIYPAALERLEQVNEIGFEHEVLEAFAGFLAKDSGKYRSMSQESFAWYLGYNSAGTPVFAASGICELGYSYYSLWYQNGEVVYGYQYSFDSPQKVDEIWEIVE